MTPEEFAQSKTRGLIDQRADYRNGWDVVPYPRTIEEESTS